MGDRKSWREIDRQRDGSAHRREERKGGGRAPRVESATASYKRTLDAFFDKGVVPDHLKDKLPDPDESQDPEAVERVKLIRAVRAAESGPPLVKAIDALRERFGLPDDLEILLRVLEHPEDPVLFEALGLIAPHVEAAERLPSKRRFVERLKGLELTSFDPRVQRKAATLVAKLR